MLVALADHSFSVGLVSSCCMDCYVLSLLVVAVMIVACGGAFRFVDTELTQWPFRRLLGPQKHISNTSDRDVPYKSPFHAPHQ